MRTIILIALMMVVTTLKAQTYLPGSFFNNGYRGSLTNNFHLGDSSSANKWFVSKYSAISSSFTFFRGGNATILSAPMGFQLNRRLNNNLYAFAGVSLAPAYVNFNRAFMANNFNKQNQNNSLFKSGNLGLYSRAELGLQYINDEKTFSISGSIGVERNTYPVLPYYQLNNTNSNHIMSAK
ncbi:MAG: hypothetical protein ABIN89_21480 [Chitinophagaceae bacterium]